MSTVIRSLMIKVGADLTDMQKNFKQMSKDLKNVGNDLQSAGSTLTKGITFPLAGAAAASAKFGADFEDSLAKVSTIADTSKKSLKEISEEVLNISSATGTAATEINEALYQAISAGADTAKATELVEVAVKAAKGGFTDTTTAVDGLTSVLNTYSMGTQDAEELANKFLVTQNKGKTTFGELAASIGKVAPTAAAVGVSIDDLLGGIASLTANGIGTSEAVTGLKAALSNVIKPSQDAINVAEQLGIDFSTAALESKGLAGFLEEVRQKTGGNVDTMSKLFGSVEALNTVLTLTSDNGTKLMNDTLKEMTTNTTAVDDAFDKVTGTSSEQWKKTLNELKNVSIEIGQVLLPVMNDLLENVVKPLVKKISEMVSAFREMSPEMQNTALAIGALVLAAGPIISIAGAIASAISFVTAGFAAASAVMTGGGGIIAAIGAFLGPVGIVLAVLAAVGVAAFVIIKNWDSIKEFFSNLWDGVSKAFAGAWDAIEKGYNNAIEWFKKLPLKIKEFFEKLPENLGIILGLAIGNVIKFGINFGEWIKTEVPKAIGNMVTFFKELPGKILTALSDAIKNLGIWTTNMIAEAKVEIPKFVTSVVDGIKAIPGNMLSIGKDIVTGLWSGIQEKVTWLGDKVKEFAGGVTKGIKKALGINSPSKVMAAEVGKWIPAGIAEGITNSRSLIDGAMNGLKSRMTTSTLFESNNGGMTIEGGSSTTNLYLDGKKVATSTGKVQYNRNSSRSRGMGVIPI